MAEKQLEGEEALLAYQSVRPKRTGPSSYSVCVAPVGVKFVIVATETASG